MTRLKLICLLASFSLTVAGCQPTVKTVCPALKQYSRADLTRLAAEYSTLPSDVQSLISNFRLWRKKCAALQQ